MTVTVNNKKQTSFKGTSFFVFCLSNASNLFIRLDSRESIHKETEDRSFDATLAVSLSTCWSEDV